MTAAAGSAAVRIGISSLDVAALPIYAEATGAFERVGVRTQIQLDLGHPAEVIELVAAGTLELGYADVISITRALQARVPIVVLAPGGLYVAEEPIVVLAQAPGSALRSGADLAGRVVHTPAEHDLARLSVRAWVDREGGDAATVRFVWGRKMIGAAADLAAGVADAFIISEPQRTLQAADVRQLGAPMGAIAPRFLMGAYVAGRAWSGAQAPMAQRLAAALHETAAWANGHRAKTAPILAERLRFAPAITTSMTRAAYAEAIAPEILEPVLRVAARYGAIAPLAGDGFAGWPVRL